MIYLYGLDVAPHRTGDGGDLRHHARAVHHGDAHFQELVGTGHPLGRERLARIRRHAQERLQSIRIALLDGLRVRGDDLLHLVQATGERLCIVERDAAPQLRRACSHARGVLEAARRQAHERVVLISVVQRQAHER